ncbi:hypothetical protein [Roseateles sp.]|uniref:hypothetical protein n=1 Tax=Roseateles sp. TaxID=1971397 RepID=UPI0039ED1D4E
MKAKTPHVALALLSALWLGATPATADISLKAADAPVDTPWTQPASISLVREKGINTVTADVVLKYQSERKRWDSPKYAADGSYGIGVYLHRDNTVDAQKNDRGITASYSGLVAPNMAADGGVASLAYSLKASTGKGLVEVEPVPGTKTMADKTKNRIVATLGGFYQPGFGRGATPKQGVQPGIFFIDGGINMYLDESRGNNVPGTGRLTGASAKLALNYAPFGLEPMEPTKGLAMVPTLRLAAQTQHDLSASGSRIKANRNLYTADFALLFAKPDTDPKQLVPTLTLSRSVGADVLVGRKQSAKTELTFGVSF